MAEGMPNGNAGGNARAFSFSIGLADQDVLLSVLVSSEAGR